jgi:hypothetical protein
MFSTEFFITLQRCMYERSASQLFYTQAFTSSIDAGHVYVDRKLFVNCFSSLPQLPMESSGSLPNQDRNAPVRCKYKLCIAVALEPLSILMA